MSEGKKTRLVTAGRNKKWTLGVVNPPVQRASTVVFDTVAQKKPSGDQSRQQNPVLRTSWHHNPLRFSRSNG